MKKLNAKQRMAMLNLLPALMPNPGVKAKDSFAGEGFRMKIMFFFHIIMMALHRPEWLDNTLEGFDKQQSKILAACVLNALLWGLDATDLAAILADQTTWTALASLGLDKHTRTEGQQKAMVAFLKDTYKPHFRDYVMSDLKRNKKITVEQRTAMGIPQLDDHHHTIPLVKIATLMYLSAGGKLSGTIRINGHSEHDASGRGHIPHGDGIYVDSMELAYGIYDTYPTSVPDADSLGNPITKAFGARQIFHKGSFLMSFGTANSNKYVVIYARWTNEPYPQFAGDWCPSPIIMRIP